MKILITGASRGIPNGIIPRFLSSLKTYHLPLYPPYTEDELNKYRPSPIF